MDLLFIDACPRGRGISRTWALADGFLAAYRAAHKGAETKTHVLDEMRLEPLTGATLTLRESLIQASDWGHDLFAPARDFISAKRIVIAAPYWDLSFPASLKTYIEHLFIREMTFHYKNDTPHGLCQASHALYLTTAGGIIGEQDFGSAYLRATLTMLGISRFDCVQADRLDMQGTNVRDVLDRAAASARALVHIDE